MEEGLKRTIALLGIGFAIFLAGTGTCFVMHNYGPDRKLTNENGDITMMNQTQIEPKNNWLTGKWNVVVIDNWSNVLEKYNLSISSYLEDIYFTKNTTVVGKGELSLSNETIFVQTFQNWSKYGNLMISIIDHVKMRAVPETNVAKWLLIMKE